MARRRRKSPAPVTAKGQCVDCEPGNLRLVARPGPRCGEHKRARALKVRNRAHDAHLRKTYGITAGDYSEILEAQGGVCFICQRATGKTRKLSVDHDHALGSGREAVRGLLCRPCNSMLGHARDSVVFFQRSINYLTDPPAREVLNR